MKSLNAYALAAIRKMTDREAQIQILLPFIQKSGAVNEAGARDFACRLIDDTAHEASQGLDPDGPHSIYRMASDDGCTVYSVRVNKAPSPPPEPPRTAFVIHSQRVTNPVEFGIALRELLEGTEGVSVADCVPFGEEMLTLNVICNANSFDISVNWRGERDLRTNTIDNATVSMIEQAKFLRERFRLDPL